MRSEEKQRSDQDQKIGGETLRNIGLEFLGTFSQSGLREMYLRSSREVHGRRDRRVSMKISL